MSLIETFKLKAHTVNHLAGLTMTEQFCTAKLHDTVEGIIIQLQIFFERKVHVNLLVS